jgi:sugar lactone lactonase YvrE
MKRFTATASLLVALSAAACGEPLVVLGDLPGVMRIVIGVPMLGGTTVDSIAVRTRLLNPSAVAALPNGDVLVVDFNRRIIAVTPGGRARLVYQAPTCGGSFVCPVAFNGLHAESDSTLLIADNQGNRVMRLHLRTRAITLIAGNGQVGSSPDGTTATQAALLNPSDVHVAPDGRILFVESGAHRVRAINPDGRIATIAGTGVFGRDGDGGPAVNAQLNSPQALTVHGSSVFVTETGNNTVRRIDLQTGTINLVAGSGVQGYSGDGGSALEAKIDRPRSIDVSPDGLSIFFAETGTHRVRVVNLADGTIATFAGTGTTAYTGNGRAAGETALNTPTGLAVAPQGYLFIADTNHHLVWRTPIRF